MELTHQLKTKSDTTLISDLKTLVTQERATLTEILKYLKEVEERRLFLARGYSSLFAFLTEELGYSESAAQRRIVAMRLIREVPEAEEKIERGDLSLTVASQVGTFLRQETQKRRKQKTAPITKMEKLDLLTTLQGTSRRECEKKLAEETTLPKERTRPITEEKTLIQFTANKSLMNKIEKLKTILAHQTNSLEALFEKLTDLALEKLDPERRNERRQKRKSKKTNNKPISPPPAEVSISSAARGFSPASRQNKNPRYIPIPLRDQIYLRDQSQCQHRDPKTGKLCGSTYKLELDHRYPHALGGENSPENLTLKCRTHNQWRSENFFGKPNEKQCRRDWI